MYVCIYIYIYMALCIPSARGPPLSRRPDSNGHVKLVDGNRHTQSINKYIYIYNMYIYIYIPCYQSRGREGGMRV